MDFYPKRASIFGFVKQSIRLMHFYFKIAAHFSVEFDRAYLWSILFSRAENNSFIFKILVELYRKVLHSFYVKFPSTLECGIDQVCGIVHRPHHLVDTLTTINHMVHINQKILCWIEHMMYHFVLHNHNKTKLPYEI